MTKGYLMNSLIEKVTVCVDDATGNSKETETDQQMQSGDQDFRYMGLNDLMTEIKTDPGSFLGDEPVEIKVLNQVLALVEDKISEVKNQAVKCLGQLIKIIRQTQMDTVVDKLIEFSGGQDEELRDISGLALKTITSELPADGTIPATACAKLIPKLLAQAANSKTSPETLIETLAILSILISRFPHHITSATQSTESPLLTLAPLLSHPRPVVRKRAILTIAQFIPISSPGLFTQLLKAEVLPYLSKGTIDRQRTTVQLVAAVARHSPAQIAPVLGDVVPGVLKAVQLDDEELREGALQAMEALVLRCPAEIASFLPEFIQVGNQFIKYDPNYAAADSDEDEEMADANDSDNGSDDGDDGELDEYSDDEDTSYKLRRSATKLLSSIIGTRPELLVALYKDVSPVLISRFADRESTVRLEVWSAYVVLLNQTAVYGSTSLPSSPPSYTEATRSAGKRKRDTEDVLSSDHMDVEETPHTLLKAQVPALSKALLAQLKSPLKTPPATLQAGFALLHALLTVLPGSLSSQSAQIASITSVILGTSPTTNSSALHLTTLSFLALFFSTHPASAFTPVIEQFTNVLLRSLGEKHPRIVSETLRVFSALVTSLKPITSAPWVDTLYECVVGQLKAHDTDVEVRACAEEVVADLWVCAAGVVRNKGGKEWEIICKGGASGGKTEGAVKVVARVGREVNGVEGEEGMGAEWAGGCVEWLMGLLRKSGRGGKGEVFSALDVLLRGYSTLPPTLPPVLIPQITPYLTTADIPLLSHALLLLSLLLSLSPQITFPLVESSILSKIVYPLSYSPLVPLDAILAFYKSLVEADNQIASHVLRGVVLEAEKGTTREGGKEVSAANVAKCVAMVVKSQQGVAAGAIAEYSKNIKATSKAKSSLVVLSLLIVGELGRFIDMSPQSEIFSNAVAHFASEQEEIRTAAAFAAGNIAIGNLHQFLPAIVKLVESDAKKRLLSLHALKEVVTHCSHGQLEGVADMLWVPLFENSDNAEESTRNVAAACLGKLATTHPSRYLPQLHARIHEQNAATRATVVSAIRYTFADTAQSYDEVLAPLLVDFLSLMLDTDLTVRRLALSALNSAARTKPHLIREHLTTLLPTLYKETVINPELIRTVQMGPWTHKVDDGLDARKTAYETMYTLLDTCLPKLDLHEFLSRVLPGLSDAADEIKVISHMMLFRLSRVAPAAVSQRLDEATPVLETTMQGAKVTKDTVKQDLERSAELQRSALRAVVALSKIGNGISPKFDAFADELKKSATWGVEFKELEGSQ